MPLGHAALLIEERGVLVAGDMLSDVLIPFLDLDAPDPIEDYLAALRLLDGVAGDVEVLIPGHGSVGGADQLRDRIEKDRAYVHALRDGGELDDTRESPTPGWPLTWVIPNVADPLTNLAAVRVDENLQAATIDLGPDRGESGLSQASAATIAMTITPTAPSTRSNRAASLLTASPPQ